MAPEVAILVVTYGNADEIESCLTAALAQGADQPVEVVVVDNASPDGTADLVEAAFGDRVRLVRSDANRGFAWGVNRAFSQSVAPFVLLLNPDCAMDRGCVAALLAHLRADPGCGVAAALLRDPDGSLQLFARREVSLRVAFWNFTELGRRMDERFYGGRHREERRYADLWRRGIPAPVAVDSPAAACVLVRRSDVAPAPMREDLPLFFNDTDLFRRLRARGLRADVVPGAGAVHAYGTTHRRLDVDRRWAEYTASLVAYVRPWWPAPRRALLVALLLLDALAALLLVRVGRGRPTTEPLARGALGALGLPGGARPWLAEPQAAWWRRR